jgi:Ca-activated chloride channel homolog
VRPARLPERNMKLRTNWCLLLSCLPVVFVACGGQLFSQTSQPADSVMRPPLATSASQAASTAENDPTRPETQPSLAVDRDPIPSPDAEDAITAVSQPSNTPGNAADIQKGKNGVYTLHEDVDEVLLDCTVIDENGRPVTDLTRNDFRVWEDNVPQTASSFRHQDLPVSMGILIDNSGSMRDKRNAVNNAALKLLQDSNRQDSAFVVNFSDKAYLDQGFTSDLVALSRGLSRFDSKGYTAMYDAVAASADVLSKYAKHPKQVLLIVSDGADNASRLDLQQAIRRVQNLGGPVVYTIGLLYDTDQNEFQRAKTALASLSEETGGVAYFPRSLDEVNSIAADVAEDIREQYTVGYHSTKPSSLGGYRFVHVEAVSPHHGKLIVRTRRGYYAKRPQDTQTAQKSNP